jgi:hypothetical protein
MKRRDQFVPPNGNGRWFVGRNIMGRLKLMLTLTANIAGAQTTVTNAYDVAGNYSTFSGNEGYGFGPWALSTPGGLASLANGGFMLANNTANETSTATRIFHSPLTPSQSFTVMLQLDFLGDTDCEDGIQLQDANGNVLFSYYHYGNEANANNGEYTDGNVAVFNYPVSSNALQTLYAAAINRSSLFLLNPFTLLGVVAGQACAGTVATNASDPYGELITFGKGGGPAWLNIAGNGSLSGTPLSSNVGVNSFMASATDFVGLSNPVSLNVTEKGIPSLSATQNFLITERFYRIKTGPPLP